MSPSNKLKFAIKASAGHPIASLAREAKVSRPTIYAWTAELESSGEVIFGHGNMAPRLKIAEQRNEALIKRVDDLQRLLRDNSIPVPKSEDPMLTELETYYRGRRPRKVPDPEQEEIDSEM